MTPDADSPVAGTPDTQALDAVDRELLDIIQTDFPVTPRPYQVLGGRLGITEDEALARVKRLRERGIIRRIGANFNSAKLGFRSTLCAAKVPEERLDAFVDTVNAHPGVTHNYLRAHVFNVWFTMIGPSWETVCEDLDAITERTGIPILNLPAIRMYKIRVNFPMQS
jgi:Transcriptional regulators